MAMSVSRTVLLALALGVGVGGVALARDDDGRIERRLTGFQEVPAVISTGSGTVKLQIFANRVTYELSYRGLEGAPIMAHIHVGQPAVNGGIAAWLCKTSLVPASLTPPPGTPDCPSPSGSVSGTITARSLFTPVPAQSVDRFADFLTALRAGVAYANVHSTEVPAGEIRADLGHRFHR
jgi:hypothetical protein